MSVRADGSKRKFSRLRSVTGIGGVSYCVSGIGLVWGDVMFKDYFERVHRSFANQFEADGSEYVYRKNMKGPAIRVGAREKERMVAAFDRILPWTMYGMLAAVLLLIALAVMLLPDISDADSQILIYVGLVFTVALYLALFVWI
jgi:hypothetical protein